MNEGATNLRDAWTQACARYDELARFNAFFAPLAGVVRTLANGPCAELLVAHLDGVDLRLHSARADVPGDSRARAAAAYGVRLRALTDEAIEIRCVECGSRGRLRVRIVPGSHAAGAVERCLWELGWIPEPVWRDWS